LASGPHLAEGRGMKIWTAFVCALLVGGCTSAAEEPIDDERSRAAGRSTRRFPRGRATVDDGWVPRLPTAPRFGVFYRLSKDVLVTAEPTGLPQVAATRGSSQSHATAYASKGLAELVHRRDDFYYAPAFDVWDAKHDGWQTTTDTQLRQWAHDFRDTAIAAHADLFTFNEAPTTTPSSDNIRVRIAKILRFLHEPDAQGRQLWGVTYFTQSTATGANWNVPASDFFKAIDETSVALIAEFYHSTGYTCANSQAKLATHYFSLRDWLVASGEPAKLSIANSKFTVLHSSRFAEGVDGWAGGDATTTSLARYQRALSRATQVTRATAGGFNRLAFGPVTSQITKFGVQPRITALFRWHYLHEAAQTKEMPCIDGFAGNCNCN
jgi:hypothetical protein